MKRAPMSEEDVTHEAVALVAGLTDLGTPTDGLRILVRATAIVSYLSLAEKSDDDVAFVRQALHKILDHEMDAGASIRESMRAATEPGSN